jgi:hypothetical protein
MTTTPSRIERIRPALDSVIAQSASIEHIEMNIPYVSARTNELYALPRWLEGMDRVKIFRTEDYGPITNVAPTLLRHRCDHDTYIWSVDGDYAYPTNQLEMLCRCHRPENGAYSLAMAEYFSRTAASTSCLERQKYRCSRVSAPSFIPQIASATIFWIM